jgi:RNA polymerase sigma-70 factor (ECF subfamily)
MKAPSAQEITVLLRAWHQGDGDALEKLTPRIYDELHRTARRYMATERPDHTLQATALIGQTYLRLVRLQDVDWQDRTHFYAVCATLMRRILTDYARARLVKKRAAAANPVLLIEGALSPPMPRFDVLEVDEALSKLAAVDERLSRIVELRFFGGLTEAEIASLLNVSDRTIRHDWKLAKLWLLRELTTVKRNGH